MGGMSTSVVDVDVIEPRRTEAVSSTLGLRRFIGASCSSSELERGVLADDADCADRLPDADFHDLRMDLRTLLFLSGAAGGGWGDMLGDGVAEGGRGGKAGEG